MPFQDQFNIKDIEKYQKALDEKNYAQQKICLASMPFLAEWPCLKKQIEYDTGKQRWDWSHIFKTIEIVLKDWTPLVRAAILQDQEAVDITLQWQESNYQNRLIQRSLTAIRNAIDICFDLDIKIKNLPVHIKWNNRLLNPANLRKAGRLICIRAFEGENHEHDFDLSLSESQKVFFERQLATEAGTLNSTEALISFYNENFNDGFIGTHTRFFSFLGYPKAKKEFVEATQRKALRILAEQPEEIKSDQAHNLQQAGVFDDIHFNKGGIPDHLDKGFKKYCP